ncbi:hypothetical protein [Calothrix sp. PCC 7507]|uniref:hypothetical protein n=1 Tax=Calothrix sp. PCC 7507 TaxID=99598 RepID=UPI00029EE393|nr:hypothetical protein [Calothrix sp. PCC 7507]AFY35373.1 hypothetical protein Cal7507_5024 [Calothrix sp. PCC 7507]
MLKPLLLSGWFRVQPFLKYVVVVILIAPLVVASGHSTSAKQSEVAKNTFNNGQSGSMSTEEATFGGLNLAEILKAGKNDPAFGGADSELLGIAFAGESQLLPTSKVESLAGDSIDLTDDSPSNNNVAAPDLLKAVELAPSVKESVSEQNLVERLRAAKVQSLSGKDSSLPRDVSIAQSLSATQTAPNLKPKAQAEVPVSEPVDGEQAAQTDPLGSPHPIPWKWITATQEAIGSKGGSAVRYYRSVPVVSPDGKYVVYSRVKLEVKPEMYNSRVTSVLFVEDTQTRKLRVIASTSILSDSLLQAKAASEQSETNGTIGVLVPVSWSEKGDRFLARKFEGVFNTAEATDHAVIWDRQNSRANTVAPAAHQDDHERIAILLGWSKSQPDNALFRAGELGEENWPLMKVASDGKTVTTAADQPVTFGDKITEVWAGPQVASR